MPTVTPVASLAAPPPLTLLETLLTEAAFGVAYIDADLRYVRVNDRMAAMNGAPAADHVGRRPEDVIPHMPPENMLLLQHVLSTAEAIRGIEIEVPNGPGDPFPRSFRGDTVAVRGADGVIVGLAVMATEVSGLARRAPPPASSSASGTPVTG